MSMAAYRDLEQRFRRIAVLGGAEAVLHWDNAVMMPPGGAPARAEQLAELKVLRHEMATAPAVADLLAEADAGADRLTAWQAANLREMRRRWRHAAALPADLVAAQSRAGSACEDRWRSARAASDFEGLRPLLEEVVRLAREAAAAKSAAFGFAPYDALMDQYEPGLRTAAVDPLFDRLAGFLPGFLEGVLERQAAEAPPLQPAGPFPVERQKALSERLMRALGFDFRHGRLDVSHHPFTGGIPDDVRLTTRYDEADFTGSLMGTLHETGHALYERALPAEWRFQPVGDAMGMAVHESQSLIVEMQACRSDEFVAWLAPLLAGTFGGAGEAWGRDNLLKLYRGVERGLIRVDADEVTYPLHVILRYRLEQGLVSGDLAVADLPAAWNAGMRELLGVEPPDHASGCLQDIHWTGGDFGYFPTYTLGAVAAAQLFRAACAGEPDLLPGIARGDFAPMMVWLNRNVHGQGCLHGSADDLLARATGRPLQVDDFLAHLEARYGG